MGRTKITLKMAPLVKAMTRLDLTADGPVQARVDQLVLEYCEPYIPRKTGRLIESGRAEGGRVVWDVPYARRQYYENRGQSGGQRGRLWFERMKVQRGKEIIQEAARMCGGRAK